MCYSYLKKKKQRSQICPHHQVATDFACVYHFLADCSDSDKSIEKYPLEEFSIRMGQFFRRLSLYNLDNKYTNLAPEHLPHGNCIEEVWSI